MTDPPLYSQEMSDERQALYGNNRQIENYYEPPPEIEPETLLEHSHKKILAKLRFVFDLIEAIVSVAENKGNPIAQVIEGGSKRKSVIMIKT